jgi:phage antirepressor YoqD-like protein
MPGYRGDLLVRELARMLQQQGVPMGERKLFGFLVDNGYLQRNDVGYFPTKRGIRFLSVTEKDVCLSKETDWYVTRYTVRVNPEGVRYFTALLGEEVDLMTIEKP